jgi:hypothetical protein
MAAILKRLLMTALNYALKHGHISLYTSAVPIGTRLNGHDIPALADQYVIIDVGLNNTVKYQGYWQFS